MLPPNDAQFAEEREGHQGVGSANSQVACDLFKLAQTSLQLSSNVICKEREETFGHVDSHWVVRQTHIFKCTGG